MKKQKIGILKQIARNKVLKQISEKEEKIGRKLELKEKRSIRKKVMKELRIRGAILGTVGILGIGGAIALNSQNKVPKLPETTIESEIGNDTGNSKGKRNEYVQSLYYDAVVESGVSLDIAKQVAQEINELETPDEVLEYTKQIYVNEHNETNEEKIDTSDVKIRKSSFDKVFYMDTAQNGDEILRYCSEAEAKEKGIGIDGEQPVISVEIDGKTREKVAYYRGEYVPIYSEYEEVQQYEEGVLVDLAEVLQTGIDRATSMVQEDTWSSIKSEYKQRFINAVARNRQKKQEEIEKTDTPKNTEAQLIDEERE